MLVHAGDGSSRLDWLGFEANIVAGFPSQHALTGSFFLQKAKSAEYQKETTEGKGFNSCDTYALAAAINDNIVIKSDKVLMSILCF